MSDLQDLNKDPRVLELLRRIDLHARGWIVCDHWDGDMLATGISSTSCPDRLVYVAIGKFAELFNYECEILLSNQSFQVTERGDEITYEELVFKMNEHLGQ
jgi:hypothetical protein